MQQITVVFRCWFDADKKFALHINDMDDVWLNMYGKYDPYADTLRIECEIDKPGGCVYFDYVPTDAESQLIKDMITQKIREEYCQTPQEFCEEARTIENGGNNAMTRYIYSARTSKPPLTSGFGVCGTL